MTAVAACALAVPTIAAEIATARSAPSAASKLDVGYTMALWEIPIGRIAYKGDIAGDRYSATMQFATGAFVSIFWKSAVDTSVTGKVSAGTFRPSVYTSFSRGRAGKQQHVKVTYSPGAEPEMIADPQIDLTVYPVSSEQKKGAIDPLSAVTSILAGANRDARNPCGAGVAVFDGRRRYDVTLTFVRDETVSVGNFHGTAHLCEVRYKAIAGIPQEFVNASELPPVYGDFIEVLAPATPRGHYVVALKLWTSVFLTTVTATLSTLEIDGVASGMVSPAQH